MSTDSYLGGSDAQQIYPANTVDLIVVGSDSNKKDYRLSQDVPGGYEGNVLVVRGGLVLQPEAEYTIDYSNTEMMNNIITFQIDLFVNDQIFVIHKGAATYNMAPSPGSVTDASLCDNLRGFIFETFDGGDDEYILSKQEWHPRSLLVYVDGVIKRPFMEFVDGDLVQMPEVGGLWDGTWDFALVKIDDNTSKVVFASNTAVGTKNVAILHLAFSTVLRRSNYISAVTLDPGSIETQHLQDNSVTGQKILLENDEYLRAKNFSGVSTGIIKLDPDNKVNIYDMFHVEHGDTYKRIEPILDDQVDLGSPSKRFNTLRCDGVYASSLVDTTALHSQTLTVADWASLKGGVTIGQSDSPVGSHIYGTTVLVDTTNLGINAESVVDIEANNQIILTSDNVSINTGSFTINGSSIENIPIGVVLPYLGNSATPNDKWLFCDGSLIPSDSKYNALKTWLGLQGLSTTNTPNLKQKFLFGKDSSLPVGGGKNVGDNIGSKTHSHSVNNHNHTLSSTNVTITDAGHTHDVSGKVYVPSHTHYLNVHDHAAPEHSHLIDYMHYHTIHNIDTESDSNTHTHTANYKKIKPVLGGSQTQALLCRKETGLESTSISENEQTHAHKIKNKQTQKLADTTGYEAHFFSTPQLLDWGAAQDPDKRPRSETVSGGDTGNPKNAIESIGGHDYTYSWNRTRYNRWDETNPNNMSVPNPSSKELSLADGTADSNTANSTISGSTENKTGLTTLSNSDFAVPGFTLNFIIRAVA